MTTSQQPFADKILEQIEEQHVAPTPRWVFVAKNTAFWGLWILSMLIGAAALAASLFVFTNAGWEFRELTHSGFVMFFVENVPLLWILALCLMLVLGIENLRHTKTGYRYPMIALFSLNLFGSIVLGIGLFILGAGQFIDQDVGGQIPFHRPALLRQERMWTDSSRGLLSGSVIDIEDDYHQFTVQTFDGKTVLVSGGDVSEQGRDVLSRVSVVRIIGLPQDTSSTNTLFHACFVFPWEVRGGRFQNSSNQPAHRMMNRLPVAEFSDDSPCAALQTIQQLRLLDRAPSRASNTQ